MINKRLFLKRLQKLEKATVDDTWRLADGDNQFIRDASKKETQDLLSGPGDRRDKALQKRGVPAEALAFVCVNSLFADNSILSIQDNGELPRALLTNRDKVEIFHWGGCKVYF